MNAIKGEIEEISQLWSLPQVRAYWLISAIQNLGTGWFFATYTLFLLGNGLSLLQVNLVNSVFMIVDTLFNPYTGKMADRWGQKKLFLAGQFFWFLGMLTYGLSHTFWFFVASEVISAIGSALMSDALESWFRNTNSEELTHKTMAHAGTFGSIGLIPAAVLGGIIGAKFGLEWPWFVSAATGVVVLGLTLKLLWKLPESYGGMEEETQSVKEVFVGMMRSRPLRFTATITFGIALFVQPFNMFWAPVLKEVSGETWWLGSIWIGISIMSAVGSQWARKQTNGEGVAKMILLIGLPMLLTPWIKWAAPLVAVFLLHEMGRGAQRPILFTYANKHIENRNRSTANSIQSSMKTLGAAGGLLLSGWLTLFLTPVEVWGVSAIGLIFLAGYAWRTK